MIASFRSKALERFWWKDETHRVDPKHVRKLTLLLDVLEQARSPEEMDRAGFHFHALSGDLAGRFSLRVDKNWRLTFGWEDPAGNAIDVDYEDYH
jgi:toxin HigB-1